MILVLAAIAGAWFWLGADETAEREPGSTEVGEGRAVVHARDGGEVEPAAAIPAEVSASLPDAVSDWWHLSTPSPNASSPMAAILERADTVVVVSKTNLVRYEPGRSPGTVLATSRESAAAAGLSYIAFAAIGGGEELLWIGTWKGALFELRKGRLSAVAAESAEVGRIHEIYDVAGDEPWIAARGGLLRLDREARRLVPVPGLPGEEARSVTRATTGELHVALGSSIWAQSTSGSWSRRWSHPDRAFLTKIVALRNGEILVASRRGFAVWRESRKPEIDLAEHWVTDFALPPSGEIWVATWDRGLLRPPSAQRPDWSAFSPVVLPDPSLSFALADREGSIWLGFYAEGVRTFAVGRASR